jgi:hypothetical protein
VVVGPEGQRFGIHKDRLCSSSAYFKAAFEGRFQEAARGEVVLKGKNAMAFGVMVEWLYTGNITEELCQDRGLSNVQKLAKDRPTFSQLLDVWILADYLLAPQLQNFLVDLMEAKHMKRADPPSTTSHISTDEPKRVHQCESSLSTCASSASVGKKAKRTGQISNLCRPR